MHPLSAKEKGNLLFILQKAEKSEERTLSFPGVPPQTLGNFCNRKVKGDKHYKFTLFNTYTVSTSLHFTSWIDYAPPKMCAFYWNFAHSIQIFLNTTRKFAQNLNWIRPKKSFWKIEYAHCNDADTVCVLLTASWTHYMKLLTMMLLQEIWN